MSSRTVLTIAALAALELAVVVGISDGQARGGGGFTQPDPIAFDDHAGWTSIFDGISLKNWEGNPEVWRLESGPHHCARQHADSHNQRPNDVDLHR